MRKLSYLILLFAILLLNACSGSNSDAPSDTDAHPQDWLAMHAGEASASEDYRDCAVCHGVDFSGEGEVVSCYNCHSFNTEPPFSIHPAAWDDPDSDHRAYAALNGFSSCNACHGPGLRGNDLAPSCFSSDFSGSSCHADGPGEVPHLLDGSFLDSAEHGPMAKADLVLCQACHGEAGGSGDNPRFNVGIFSAAGTGCESGDCHAANYAHPQEWAGPNNTFHYSSENIQQACTLCHGEALTGPDSGGVGVTCVGCHDSVDDFTLDCAFCHGYPPVGEADVATTMGVDHSVFDTIAVLFPSHADCQFCHGLKESTAAGYFDAASGYTLFDLTTDTPGYHWDGQIQLNSAMKPVYDADSVGCILCHPDDSEYQVQRSDLPINTLDFN